MLSIIINTRNEGPRVATTCHAFIDHCKKHNLEHEIIVCADGTTDGSCDSLPLGVRVIRNKEAKGCGKAKFTATELATGNVLMWVDAHQTPLVGDLTVLVKRALESNCIICPGLGNIAYDITDRSRWLAYRCSDSVFYPNNTGILPIPSQYIRSPLNPTYMVSVGLCMSRETYQRIGGWNRYRGRLGSQERGIALKAFMAGIDIIVEQDVIIGHEFFGTDHPSRNNQTGTWRPNNLVRMECNLWHAYMAVCTEAGFKSQIEPWLLQWDDKRHGRYALNFPEAIADRDYFHRHCKRRPDKELFDLIEHLMVSVDPPVDPGTAALEPAAIRLLGAYCYGRVLELGTGSGAGTLRLLEAAQSVVSVDHKIEFTRKARENIQDERATFIHAPLAANSFYDMGQITGRFDAIIIDGPPGTRCRRNGITTVLPFLAPGGIILIDDAHRDKANIDDAISQHNLVEWHLPTCRGLSLLAPKAT